MTRLDGWENRPKAGKERKIGKNTGKQKPVSPAGTFA